MFVPDLSYRGCKHLTCLVKIKVRGTARLNIKLICKEMGSYVRKTTKPGINVQSTQHVQRDDASLLGCLYTFTVMNPLALVLLKAFVSGQEGVLLAPLGRPRVGWDNCVKSAILNCSYIKLGEVRGRY